MTDSFTEQAMSYAKLAGLAPIYGLCKFTINLQSWTMRMFYISIYLLVRKMTKWDCIYKYITSALKYKSQKVMIRDDVCCILQFMLDVKNRC